MPESTLALEIIDASFRYHGADTVALSELSLTVQRGEMVAVLGPQGSGTSTLCRLAAGLLGDRGDAAGSVRSAPGAVAMLGDDPESQITGMTSFVDDEVRLPTRLFGSGRAVDPGAALASFGMARLVGRRLDTLSGGERQLVALASLTTLTPELLVLDQPALSLDPVARALLLAALRGFCADGGAVLLAGHQHDELTAAADRVEFLRSGRRVSRAAPRDLSDELLAAHGVWNTMPGPDSDLAASSAPESVSALECAPGQAPSPLLEARDLTVTRGGATIFSGIDLGVSGGEVLAVVGANGAGKSTLLRALSGLLGRDASVTGEISVRNRGGVGAGAVRIDRLPAWQRAGWLGWVGQDPGAQLSAATALAELETSTPLPPHRRRERARLRDERAVAAGEMLLRVGLGEQADDHPYDLNPAQRKELVIGSALLLRPDVLLLDEPTLGRDLAGMRRLDRIVRDFTEAGGAVVVTTHDLRWAREIATRQLNMPVHLR